jgi:predicted aspartyl protease
MVIGRNFIKLVRYITLLTLSICALSGNAIAQDLKARDAMRLLEKSRHATGGTAWDRIQNFHFTVTPNIPDSFNSGEEWVDLVNERVRQSLEETDGLQFGSSRDKAWMMRYDTTDVRAPSPTDISIAYNETFGMWRTHHPLASAQIIGHERKGKRKYTIVRVVPQGGNALDYWIDDATALIWKAQFHNNDGKQTMSSEYDDYRFIGAVRLPFHQTLKNSLTGDIDYDLTITNVVANAPFDDTVFEQPPAEKIQGFLPDERGIQVPFTLQQNHIMINVMLNDHGPFHFVLDSGAGNIVSPETVRAAQLQSGENIDQYGFGNGIAHGSLVHVQITSLGSLSLHNQTFSAVELPANSGIDGIIGYEWLKRLPVRIDYANRVLTLYNPDSFQYEGEAAPVALQFKEIYDSKTGKSFYPAPRVEAAIDGMPGLFDVDTGDFESIMVSHEFSEQHALLRHYPVIGTSTNNGLNNTVLTKLVTRAGNFRIGDNYVPNKLLEIAPRQQQGILADLDLAGNIGYEVLREFNITLDYRHHAMYLEPNIGMSTLDYYSALCGDCIAP